MNATPDNALPVATGALPKRGRYQGMLQIFKFNRHLYGLMLAFASGLVAFAILAHVAGLWRIGAFVGAAVALYWGCASLLVSHWIYDLSPVYRWAWIKEVLVAPPAHWVNIHAGLDESTPTLKTLFPGTHGEALDIFDADAMTEKSISAARTMIKTNAGTAADFRDMPIATGALDAAFLIFAAHELRKPSDRETLFREVCRGVRPGGQVLLVEHLRDLSNFAGFGPGFLHFLPRYQWLNAIRHAELEITREFKITPFVTVFLLRRPQ